MTVVCAGTGFPIEKFLSRFFNQSKLENETIDMRFTIEKCLVA